MGRTIPSYRMLLEGEIGDWRRFGEFLRKEDREAFDELMNICRLYASYSGAACRPIVSEAMFMAILLSHQKAIHELLSQVEDLKAKLAKASLESTFKNVFMIGPNTFWMKRLPLGSWGF